MIQRQHDFNFGVFVGQGPKDEIAIIFRIGGELVDEFIVPKEELLTAKKMFEDMAEKTTHPNAKTMYLIAAQAITENGLADIPEATQKEFGVGLQEGFASDFFDEDGFLH